MKPVVIIDPTTPELVRGSQCYLPYLVHAARPDSTLMEDFSMLQMDLVPKADSYMVAFWSEGQRDTVKAIIRNLPLKACYSLFGYAPLINSLPAVATPIGDITIEAGMKRLASIHATHRLAGDSDMHRADINESQIFPLYTTYGCPNGCQFCPATVGHSNRLVLDLSDVEFVLKQYKLRGAINLHVMDDDFFWDPERAHDILNLCVEHHPFHLILLATRQSLFSYLDRFGHDELLTKAGVKLIEVGLETASEELVTGMGKNRTELCIQLAQRCPVPILWLTLTFFPGETIATLRATGKFMQEHGLNVDSLCERMWTNGTYGGLGQFFVPTLGTKGYDVAKRSGTFLSSAPLRLVPGYIPDSFSECEIQSSRPVTDDELFWYSLYRTTPGSVEKFVGSFVEDLVGVHWNNREDGFTSLAISARLGVIE